MSGHTYTQDNYSNPRCAHVRRGLIIFHLPWVYMKRVQEMKSEDYWKGV